VTKQHNGGVPFPLLYDALPDVVRRSLNCDSNQRASILRPVGPTHDSFSLFVYLSLQLPDTRCIVGLDMEPRGHVDIELQTLMSQATGCLRTRRPRQ